MLDCVKVLFQKAFAQPVPGIGQQRIDRAALQRRAQLWSTPSRLASCLHRLDLRAKSQKVPSRFLQRLVGRHQQVKTIFSAALGQVVANARRGAGDDG